MMRITAILILLLSSVGCAPSTLQGEQPTVGLTNLGVKVRPGDLTISEVRVFDDPIKTHDHMKNIRVIVTHIPRTAQDLIGFEGQFLAGQKIEWMPIRSSGPAEHRFVGTWTVKDNGMLAIVGEYEATGNQALNPELKGITAYVMPTIILRRGSSSYTHTVELHIKKSTEKIQRTDGPLVNP